MQKPLLAALMVTIILCGLVVFNPKEIIGKHHQTPGGPQNIVLWFLCDSGYSHHLEEAFFATFSSLRRWSSWIPVMGGADFAWKKVQPWT